MTVGEVKQGLAVVMLVFGEIWGQVFCLLFCHSHSMYQRCLASLFNLGQAIV